MGVNLPAEMPQSALTILIDTREQNPFSFHGCKSEPATLATGDYSLKHCEHLCAIERKAASDMLGCFGRERERFEREVQRLLAYPCRALVIESSWEFFERGDWRGSITPSVAVGSLLGWAAMGLPVLMLGNHDRAGRYVAKMLSTFARRRWRENRGFIAESLRTESEAPQ